MNTFFDIAIIGGGASGLISAISSSINSKNNLKIAVFEKEDKIGKKLLATGNGRCNLSNTNINDDFYYGSCKDNALTLFKTYNSTYITNYFKTLGLFAKTDDCGRIYPLSNCATSVLDILKMQCTKHNVEIICNCDITDISKTTKNTYTLSSSSFTFECNKIILTVGGKASVSKFTNNGYSLLEQLSIKQAPIFPSLSPILVKEKFIKSLKGNRTNAKVTLNYVTQNNKNKSIFEIGEVQFTEKALSGICVFQLSRFTNEFFTHSTINGEKTKSVTISVDLFPTFSNNELLSILMNRFKSNKTLPIETLLFGLINYKIANSIYKICGIKDLNNELSTLNIKTIENIAYNLKNLTFNILDGTDNFMNAQVTSGGVLASECDFSTMQYVKDKNIFFAGEILDLDGLCGGYNLHWAWVSGIIVGENATKN